MSNNIFLLIMTPHLKKGLKELESISVFVPIFKDCWNRAEKNLDAILKQRYEGNLLAYDQALAKPTFLKAPDIFENSRFNLIDLLDACILGNTKRCIHIMKVLQMLDFDVSIILWNLISELRILLSKKLNTEHKIALQRLSIYSIHNMLLVAQNLDNAIKNKDNIPIWVSLNNLALMLAAKPYE